MSLDKITIKEAEASFLKEEYKFKIVIVGDSGVGKTNLVKRFIQNTFSSNTLATVGVEFFSNNYYINDKLCKIEMWDTAGQERYKSMTSAYYKGAMGAILVYDVTNQVSFNNIERWYNEIRDFSSKDIQIIMVGNKTDLQDKIIITNEMSQNKSADLEIPVVETSALNASNVKEAFHLLIKEIYKEMMRKKDLNKDNSEINNNAYNIISTNFEPKQKSCC
jgi:small GTP-binding protein